MADGPTGRRSGKIRPAPSWTDADIVGSPQVTFFYGQTAPKRRSLQSSPKLPAGEGEARIPVSSIPEMTEVTVYPVEEAVNFERSSLEQHNQEVEGQNGGEASHAMYTAQPARKRMPSVTYISTKSGEERAVRPITPIRTRTNGKLSVEDKKIVEFRQYAALFGIVGTYYTVFQDERKCLRKMYRLQKKLTYIAFLSVILGVYVNELCVAPDYVISDPTEEFVRDIETGSGRTCDSSFGNYAKMGQSFLTVILLLMLVRRHQLKFRLHKIRQHYGKKGRKLDARESRTPKSMYMSCAADLILTAIHTVPFFYMDIKVQLLGQTMFYRLESIATAVTLTRLFHVPRYLYLWSYFKYFDLSDSFLVRDIDTILLLNQDDTNISRSMVPLKVLMSKHPFRAIVIILGIIFFALSYLLRIAEGPAYQPHSIYFWDQMFMIITQGSTGYGGTTPQTHLGRFACCVAMGLGPMTVAFLTAAITRGLSLTEDEGTILRQMHSNRARAKKVLAATRILQFWWRENVINKSPVADPHLKSTRRYSSPLASSAMSAGSGLFAKAMLLTQSSVAQLAGRPSHQKLLKRNRQLTTDFYWASVEVERIEAKELANRDVLPPPFSAGGLRSFSAGGARVSSAAARSQRSAGSAGMRGRLRSVQHEVTDARMHDMQLKLDDVHQTVRRIEQALRLLNIPGLEPEGGLGGSGSEQDGLFAGARKQGDMSPWVSMAAQSYAERKQQWQEKHRSHGEGMDSVKMTNVVGRRFGSVAGLQGWWSDDSCSDERAEMSEPDEMSCNRGHGRSMRSKAGAQPRGANDGSVLVETFDAAGQDEDADEDAGGRSKRAMPPVRSEERVPSQIPKAAPSSLVGARAWTRGERDDAGGGTENTDVETFENSQDEDSFHPDIQPVMRSHGEPAGERRQGGPTMQPAQRKQKAAGGRLARMSSSSLHMRGRRKLDRSSSTGVFKRAMGAVSKACHQVHHADPTLAVDPRQPVGQAAELVDSGGGAGRTSPGAHRNPQACTPTQDRIRGPAVQRRRNGTEEAGHPTSEFDEPYDEKA